MYQINIISGTKWKCPQRTCFTKPTVKLSAASEIAIELGRYQVDDVDTCFVRPTTL